MVVGEFRFHIFERAIDRQFAFQRVDDDGMPDRFEIQNIGKIQPHLPVAGFDKHGIVAIAPHHVDRGAAVMNTITTLSSRSRMRLAAAMPSISLISMSSSKIS